MISDKELILLFKKDSGMGEEEWLRFCRHYYNKDIQNVVKFIKNFYKNADFSISPTFKDTLEKEISKAVMCNINKTYA